MDLLVVNPPSSSATLPTALVCAGCGYRARGDELPLRCPQARPGDDIDHLIGRAIDTSRVEWPTADEANPFVRYRRLTHGYHVATAAGLSDGEIVAEIERLDQAVAAVEGHGFVRTPLVEVGGTLVKDETHNVSGSHKARHLFGALLTLRLAGRDEPARPLAVASCGNAALAAAVIARAARRELLVFVPAGADPFVLARLHELGALVKTCERRPGEMGDPTLLYMRERVAAGALPFTCQGNENGLSVEGGLTLGYELVDQLREAGRSIDHLFIQVGGGALASSVVQALAEAQAMGVLARLPRIHAVQTRNVHPLVRAYERVVGRVQQGMSFDQALAWAARHRSSCMWPWESAPASVAGGIVDDESHDWLAVVRGMLASGGGPVLVGEDRLREANELARRTSGIDVDVTGSAGLAGLIELRRRGQLSDTERCAVLFTGVRRNGGTR